MGAISRGLRKVWLLLGRGRFRSELDEEMAFHRLQAEKDLVAGGMSPEAARVSAIRQFGNSTRARERSEEVVGFRWETVAQDARFAGRQLRKSPGFAATAIVILALGIASSVAIFAFVDAALIKPLPYRNSTRLAVLFESIPLGPRFHLSYPDYLDWKRMNKTFSSLDVFAPYGFMEKTAQGLKPADGARVSAGFLRTLGVTPILGRDFYDGEDAAGPARTVLLSYSAWQKRYGGRADAVGQSVTLDNDNYTIIGVLPRDFHFAPAEPADFWGIQKPASCRGCHGLFGIARLRDGVTFDAAMDDIEAIAKQLEKQYPDSNRDQAAFLMPLTEVIVGDIRPILLVLLCGAALLLLIASVNVASLLLVRSETRKREIAVRGALGASPRRLVRQFITEGMLLASIGCALGVGLALESMRQLATLIPKDMLAGMPYLRGMGLNWHIAVFACGLAVGAGALFAFTPMARLRFAEIRDGLAQGGRGAAGLVWRRFGTNLVVVELATAMVLLVGAGLLGKSFLSAATCRHWIAAGSYCHAAGGVAAGEIQTGPGTYRAGARSCAALVGSTGVQQVGSDDQAADRRCRLDDGLSHRRQAVSRTSTTKWRIRMVTAGYMATLKTTLKSGRYFTERTTRRVEAEGHYRERGAGEAVLSRRGSGGQADVDRRWKDGAF